MIDIKTELSRCISVIYAPTASVNKNEFVQIQANLFGFPLNNVNAGEEGSFIVECPLCEIDAIAGSYSAGQDIYINPSNPNQPATTTSTGNHKIGRVYQSAVLSGVGKIKIVFRQTI